MDLVSYLESLPRVTLDRLYESPWTCQAVLRGLPPLAKQYVLRLLFIQAPLPEALLNTWASPAAGTKHEVAMAKLLQLHLLDTLAASATCCLHPAFQLQLQAAVAAKAVAAHAEEIAEAVLQACPPQDDLDAYSQQQWEGLLLYLVGAQGRPPPAQKAIDAPPLHIGKLLQEAGLMENGAEGGKGRITGAGFSWLLRDTYSQLWTLLREYIASAEKRSGAELASVVGFLLQLGFQEAGRPHPLGGLPQLERSIAGHLAQLGLLYAYRAEGEVWVCPTRLAQALTGGPGGGGLQDTHDAFVIVETNYRVYAYTSSPTHHAILRLFVRCECILPDLFVGSVTRESIGGALACGLGAEELISYLRDHAHPHVAARVPVVPEVVADQIRLWQADTRRVRATPAVLYEDFPSPEVFQLTVAHAHRAGVWLWDQPERRRVVARLEGHEGMRDYIKSVKDKK